jgi:peptidyl-prolyl cis-trans isomerase SurA
VALPHLVAAVLIFAPVARARTFDRVAAVAGGHVILLSEVRESAAPYLSEIHEKDPLARARAETRVLRETCERLIDDVLVVDEAERLHVTAASDEVDHAIDAIAKARGETTAAALAEAASQGVGETQYREMIRVQILRYRVMQLTPGIDRSKGDEAAMSALAAELREKVYVEDRMAAP